MKVSALDYSNRRKNDWLPFSLCGTWIFIVRSEVTTGYFKISQKKWEEVGNIKVYRSAGRKKVSDLNLLKNTKLMNTFSRRDLFYNFKSDWFFQFLADNWRRNWIVKGESIKASDWEALRTWNKFEDQTYFTKSTSSIRSPETPFKNYNLWN